MVAQYISVDYDLTKFGVFNVNNAIFSSDVDNDITFEVSFNGGKSFDFVKLNKKFSVKNNSGHIKVRIKFNDTKLSDEYKIKSIGFFQNLEIGTTVYFEKQSNKQTYSTNIGENGKYTIFLPRGIYDIWHIDSGEKIILLSKYNPEVSYIPTNRLDKENTIEMYFRELSWAKYAIFDTFSNLEQMAYGNAILDMDGDLSDGKTTRKCRYWLISFD